MLKKGWFEDSKARSAGIRVARGLEPADRVIRGGRWLDVFSGEFRTGDIAIHKSMIVGTGEPYEGREVVDATGLFIVPGFIDSHVHIESSMMTPVRFQQVVLPCGTTTAIWDPHEIANVKGRAGIDWALTSTRDLLLDVFVMVPSCVPSTSPELEFETSGAVLNAADLVPYRDHPRILGLAEMMNFPGLLNGDDEVLERLQTFQEGKRDGHCPGLTGKDLNAYGVAGIHSCHESTTAEEAGEKLAKGLHVLIREGSCARDATALIPLLNSYSSAVLSYCSDDRNPADIEDEGHINCIIDEALRQGKAPEDVFRAAAFGPARAFGLEDRGAIAPGFRADLVLVEPAGENWTAGCQIRGVLKSGIRVDPAELAREAEKEQPRPPGGQQKNLRLDPVTAEDFTITNEAPDGAARTARVIGVLPGSILTEDLSIPLPPGEPAGIRTDEDILKLAVLERHHGTGHRSTGLVRGFGLKTGAIALSINHDSHNVIVVGSSGETMAAAVNHLIGIDGGIVVTDEDGRSTSLTLPFGGLMTDAPPDQVTLSLRALKEHSRQIGCTLDEPFLQLAFLALPVIPALKITDRGLIDVEQFCKVPVVGRAARQAT